MLNSSKLSVLTESHPQLASLFRKYQTYSVKDYAQLLYKTSAKKNIDPILIDSFCEELKNTKVTGALIESFVQSLADTPVLQTSHHITPTNGPTFSSIDMISLSGLPNGIPYLVAANSGVPFSNTAWSGAISYGELNTSQLVQQGTSLYKTASKAAEERKQHGETENRISLIPAKFRDKLLFGTHLPESLENIFPDLSQDIQTLFKKPQTGLLYTQWAAQTCSKVQNTLFDRSDIIYLDINQVINRYLIKVLKSDDDKHPIAQLLLDKNIIKHVNTLFENPNFFLGNYKGKKSFKVEGLKWNGQYLTGDKRGNIPLTKSGFITLLEQNELCPGLLLLFFSLRFLNGIKCLGSFNQVEYLESFRQKLEKLPLDGLFLQPDSNAALTSGRLKINGNYLYPMDAVLKGKTINMEEISDIPMELFWEPILNQLTK